MGGRDMRQPDVVIKARVKVRRAKLEQACGDAGGVLRRLARPVKPPFPD